MPTLTVRSLSAQDYAELKSLAADNKRSMEAEARHILSEAVMAKRRWASAKLADLSGDPALAQVTTPYVRALDRPRDVS